MRGCADGRPALWDLPRLVQLLLARHVPTCAWMCHTRPRGKRLPGRPPSCSHARTWMCLPARAAHGMRRRRFHARVDGPSWSMSCTTPGTLLHAARGYTDSDGGEGRTHVEPHDPSSRKRSARGWSVPVLVGAPTIMVSRRGAWMAPFVHGDAWDPGKAVLHVRVVGPARHWQQDEFGNLVSTHVSARGCSGHGWQCP